MITLSRWYHYAVITLSGFHRIFICTMNWRFNWTFLHPFVIYKKEKVCVFYYRNICFSNKRCSFYIPELRRSWRRWRKIVRTWPQSSTANRSLKNKLDFQEIFFFRIISELLTTCKNMIPTWESQNSYKDLT